MGVFASRGSFGCPLFFEISYHLGIIYHFENREVWFWFLENGLGVGRFGFRFG